ncbi:unnamed protein product [Acanthoscelides obtectus]|uniref:Fatty acyl-CoA reductase n=1 Tax=Acanthoscelides obtectus TaxID=200917 RepID=A0A9P0LIJ3_ACAOB|nr:unnamed protein product [Acanthoscelides obtectus]CAK1656546.1 Fatty acyl-CoA reductase wat [Acanthoscelides obtectus]
MDLSLTEQEDGEPDISQLTPIQEFYKDANILITGGTGFLGKLLIEKLLRSCNELSKIYLIVRSKNGKDMPSRLEDIFQDGVFDTLKRQYPKFKRKIVGIAGDCTLPNLGLSTENRKLLQDNVNIIFHAAATLRCEEKFKIAMATNVQATKDILQLAKDTPNLKSFVYVSNVYSNFTLDKIEEKVGKPVAPYGAFLELSKFPDKLLEKMTPILLDRYPNTHVFTKQLSEVVLNELGEGLPIGIFRSATIMSTYREPINGWINNEHGPAGVIAGIFLGLIRVFHCDKNLAADIVPADMVVNALISSCWEVGVEFQENERSQVKVYNYESTTENPLRWESVVEKIYENGKECPSVQAVWHPFVIQTKCFYYMKLMMFLLHTIPAYFVDVVSFCMGKDQRRTIATYK